MSYLAYINGNLLDLNPSSVIALTKQVNDIARLDNRQSNFTHKITVPPTDGNIRAMDRVSLVGNNSNLPYQKNNFDLIDADSGENLIYKGWAIVSQTTDKGYEMNVYDGNIDFYKAIENKSLTDVDVSGLNHLKNLSSVINSFSNNLPYKYIITDYNGLNHYLGVNINIDYQIPSARVSYIWDRIFAFTGYEFTGSTFQTAAFLNLFMTFPKPVPELIPITENLTTQVSTLVTSNTGTGSDTRTEVFFFPTTFSTANGNSSTPLTINITQTGSYQLKVSGGFSNGFLSSGTVTWQVRDAANAIVSTGTVNGVIDGTAIIPITAGQRLILFAPMSGFTTDNSISIISGEVTTTVGLVLGYDASFTEVLVDFSVKDFVNEIMQRFGLTMFKHKYKKQIDFRILDEILQNPEVLDWSSKFSKKLPEKYILANYGKRNNFKYKYNDENDKFNDGFITINNENIKDEVTVIDSKIYSPQIGDVFFGQDRYVYKFWEKEVQDDATIKYQDLTGRFYFLRSENFTNGFDINIGSKILNSVQTVLTVAVASYARLSFKEIIEDNYKSIQSILDKSKIIEALFYLTPFEVSNFDFKRLIYVEQLSSYYLVNKIPNYTKTPLVRCELIEVDYLKTLPIVTPDDPIITIVSTSILNCVLTINVTTNIAQPLSVVVKFFSFPPGSVFATTVEVAGTIINNQIVVALSTVPGGDWTLSTYSFFPMVTSNTVPVTVPNNCLVAVPIVCTPTNVVISNLVRFNNGNFGNNGSTFQFTPDLQGTTQETDFFGQPAGISNSCRPFSYRIEVNSSLGLQSETFIVDENTPFYSFQTYVISINGRPTSATVKMIHIMTNGTEFTSNTLNYN